MNRFVPLLAAGLTVSGAALAQNSIVPQPLPLYSTTPPAEDNGMPRDKVTQTADILTGAADADFFLLRPDPAKATGQAVVVCPGGGYNCTCYGYEGILPAQWLQQQGILAVVLRYRVPNRHPQIPLADAQQALRMIRNHAQEWQVDPSQVGILGFSAGGHLAATASTLFCDSTTRPDFTILAYPVVTMNPQWTHAGSRNYLIGPDATQELTDHYSSEKQVTDQTPPAFIVVSSADQSVSPMNSILYYEALLAQHIPAELHIYPDGPHGFGWKTDFRYHDEMTTALSRWLRDLHPTRTTIERAR